MKTLTNEVPCWWRPHGSLSSTTGPFSSSLADALLDVGRRIVVVETGGELALARGGVLFEDAGPPRADSCAVRAVVPALCPWQLGDPGFLQSHRLRYPYVAGAMANGISSVEMVCRMAEVGMLAFFGAAGLEPDRVEQAIEQISKTVGSRSFGSNLIHSPSEPGLEDRIVDLYLRHGVRRVCASAFLSLTPAIVRYRFNGIHRAPDGSVLTPNHVFAKLSRVELARRFFAPPPTDILALLVEQGSLTAEQAELAAHLPVAQDVTAEADSGGHTDNRSSFPLIPSVLAVRDELQVRYGDTVQLRVGAAGGIGTPSAAAAAFAMGVAYVMTGSVNQACVEAGTSPAVRQMLAQAGQADVAMAPSADMFEMGVKVQVLKRATMFSVRARKLAEIYRAYESPEDLPPNERSLLERDYFRCSLEEEWAQTRAFFNRRDPRQLERADRDPKHRLALLLRSYLGRASGWANDGDPGRRVDYQIWCGPAMGAFNEWVRGTFLENPDERRVVTVGLNLMMGAAVMTRVASLRNQGIALPVNAWKYTPEPESSIRERLALYAATREAAPSDARTAASVFAFDTPPPRPVGAGIEQNRETLP